MRSVASARDRAGSAFSRSSSDTFINFGFVIDHPASQPSKRYARGPRLARNNPSVAHESGGLKVYARNRGEEKRPGPPGGLLPWNVLDTQDRHLAGFRFDQPPQRVSAPPRTGEDCHSGVTM